ncbi:hypothetical protein PENTCL1PPCAC_20322 [Pristionchus entomophagus]|uniref:Nuclear receptor n=1 Tax=Pristionchus entomophagus TaxID=358040 RepID=A0AAV5TVM4_9BILA|nr:hypothetical protein PENTCL1PPCAC_20322 [Pristionchus entomophagus]
MQHGYERCSPGSRLVRRACTVFYRRSVGKRIYTCQQAKSDTFCMIGKNGKKCRKCRFERIAQVIEKSVNLPMAFESSERFKDDQRAASWTNQRTTETATRLAYEYHYYI